MPDSNLQEAALAQLVAEAADPMAPLAEAARALRGRDVTMLPSPRDMARYFEELTAKVGPNLENVGKVKSSDADAPALLGTHGPDGFVVSVFSSDAIAREHLVTSGAIPPTGAVMINKRSWLSALRTFRVDDYAGLVLDEGAPHRVSLDRAGLERLWAALERDRLDAASEFIVVTREGRVHAEQRPDGFVYAFVFVDPKAAARSMAEMKKYGPFDTVARSKAAVPDELQALGVQRVRVDHGFANQQTYTWEAFASALGTTAAPPAPTEEPMTAPATEEPATEPATERPASAPATEEPASAPDPALRALATGEAGQSAPADDSLAGRAAAGPHVDPVPPVGDDEASSRAFKMWQKRAEAQSCEPWQLVEALAYDMSFYVAVAPEPLEGLRWPLFQRVQMQPENRTAAMSYLFTTEAAMQAFVAERPADARDYVRLSGIEMFRWLWAYPGEGSHVTIDYPDPAGWFSFPLHWLRTLLLPIGGSDYGDFSSIARVPVARLGGLGGPDRFRPEVVKALSLGWKPLTGLKPAEDGSVVLESRDDQQYLPAFSGEEQYFAYASEQHGRRLLPAPPARTPPFARWLEASRGAAGVVVDPAGPNPLTLDRTLLLVLDRCAELKRYPSMAEYVAGAARHHATGHLSDEDLGRAVAEVSVFFMGIGRRPDGGAFVMHKADDPDTGVIFTSEDAIQAFMQHHGFSLGQGTTVATVEGGQAAALEVMGRGARWAGSPLTTFEGGFTEVVVDPGPDGSGGCLLNRAALQAAVRRLEEVLRPRVDGFIWSA